MGSICKTRALVTIIICITSFLLATMEACAKETHDPAIPATTSVMPLVTDGTMATHDWTLVKDNSDEFNETKLDADKWDTDIRSWGKNWNWSTNNLTIENGILYIHIKYDPQTRNGKPIAYTSGIIESDAPIRYGYFEARIKGSLPQPGTNPAFWLGGHSRLNTPTQWTEIDILEAGERAIAPGVFRVDHVAHVFKHPHAPNLKGKSGQGWAYNIGGGTSSWDPSKNYHVYGLEWTPRLIKTYVDGRLQGSIANRWWHQGLILIVSLGLRNPYRKTSTSKGFPGKMSVDYVRVWKSKSLDSLSPLLPKAEVLTKKSWKKGLDAQRIHY